MAVKKVDPDFYPNLETIKQNADEFGIKVYQLAFNQNLHKMYCLCQSPSENEIKEHLNRLDIVCDEIVELEHQSPSDFETLSNLTKIGHTLANFSHEMRQTISIASINSRLIQQKLQPENFGQIKTYVNRIEYAMEHMTRQVNEVLDFIRVAPLIKNNISLKTILDKCLSDFMLPFDVSVKLPDDDIVVYCDAEKIQSVFSNLINNSISVKAKNITITVSDDSDFAHIEVIDDGPGISENHIAKIFEPLFTTKPTGTGLGLSICKSIVEQHDGTIDVKNNPTTFTIKLPKTHS